MSVDFSSVYIEQLIAQESIREALKRVYIVGTFGESTEDEEEDA